jgi:2-dehydropantoate 2-reductase
LPSGTGCGIIVSGTKFQIDRGCGSKVRAAFPGIPGGILRITIVGAGGVGGYFGARLARGGCEVGFVARGPHLAAIRANGLRIESQLGDFVVSNANASEDPRDFGTPDYVFLCVKLWDAEVTLRALAPVVGENTTVISFQNGVQKDELVHHILGEGVALGGVGYIGSTVARPGVIHHTGTMQRLAFGEYDGTRSPRVIALHAACVRGGIDAEISPDIRRAIWEKFVFLVGLSATTTSMRVTLGPIRSHPQTREFLLDVMREVVSVGRAHGVQLDEDYAEKRMAFVDGLPPDMDSSMHADLQREKRLELQWLSGAVVDLGKAAGIPTPMNRAVRDILALHSSGSQKA